MDDQAESSRRAFPMTPPPPPPPSPAIPEDYSSDAICWADSDNYSSSTRHTDFLSLWLSSYTAQLPHPEAEEEPVAHDPTLLNPNLESSLPDLVDWNTTRVAVKQGPVTEPLWVQLHAPATEKEEDQSDVTHRTHSPKPSISPLASGIESPKATMLPLALGIESLEASMLLPALGNQFLEASVSPLAPGIQPPTSSFEIQSPLEASISPLTGGIQPPQTYSEEETPQVSLSPLALGVQPSILPPAHGIQFPQSSISPQISPLALKMQSSQTSVENQSAPATFSSPPSIPCTLSMAPLMEIFLPSRSPVPECRSSWSEYPGTPPPAWRHLLLPHSASSNLSSPYSHPSHQADHFVPTANTGYLQEVVAGHVPVIFSTPDASANFYAGFDPASLPSWSQAMAQRGNWTPSQPWIGNGEDMELPIPQRPQLALPPAAATMSEPPLVLANFGSSAGNMPNTNAVGDVPVEDHQRVQTGKSKLAVRTDSKLIYKK